MGTLLSLVRLIVKEGSLREPPFDFNIRDVNKDKQPDFIVGEMTAAGWDFPMNAHPKIYAYINQGNKKFKKTILCEG